ncbi:MAG: hypothetical protein LUH47_05115 [Clostridiales bacterium]|nr:hypothetical protein [Clostridiales bacterium]
MKTNFFDRVVVGINKGVNTVSESSKFIIEKAKLNSQIQEVESENDKLIYNIGKTVCSLYTSNEIQLEQCSGIFEAINKNKEKIEDLKNQIILIEKQKEASLRAAAPMPETAAVPSDGTVCSCGFTNKPGANFCAKCGNKLS